MLDRDQIVRAFDRLAGILRERGLLTHLEIKTPEEALAVVGRFYPADRVPARTAYLLEAILAEEGP